MRTLEVSGRGRAGRGCPPVRARYVFTILCAALSDAVKQRWVAINPSDRSTPPSPSEAGPPDMKAWTAAELGRFLRWAETRDPELAVGWRLLAAATSTSRPAASR